VPLLCPSKIVSKTERLFVLPAEGLKNDLNPFQTRFWIAIREDLVYLQDSHKQRQFIFLHQSEHLSQLAGAMATHGEN